MGSNFEVLQLIWAILSLPQSIGRGVLYTRQVAGISWSKYRYTSRTSHTKTSQVKSPFYVRNVAFRT